MQEGPTPEGREKAIDDAERGNEAFRIVSEARAARVHDATEKLLTALSLASPAPIELPRPLVDEFVRAVAEVGPEPKKVDPPRSAPSGAGAVAPGGAEGTQLPTQPATPPPARVHHPDPGKPQPGTIISSRVAAMEDAVTDAEERFGRHSDEAADARADLDAVMREEGRRG